MNVELTPVGQRTARDLLAARGTPLSDVIAVLDDDEQEALARLLAKLPTVGSVETVARHGLVPRVASSDEHSATVIIGTTEQGATIPVPPAHCGCCREA